MDNIKLKRIFKKAGKSIVLIGFMGVGKTTIGTALSDILDAHLVDSDKEVEKSHRDTVATIIKSAGMYSFRQFERAAIAVALEASEPIILSTGGGAFLDDETRQLILSNSTAVWLQASEKTIFTRTEADYENGTVRPLLHYDENGEETTAEYRMGKIADLLKERSPIYEQCPYSINTESATPQQIANDLLKSIYSPR